MDNKRSSATHPSPGQVVLVSDPALPRNLWKLGRIISIPSSNSEKIREVQLKLPSGHIVRRPVNRLFPLDLEDSDNEPPPSVNKPESSGKPESAPRYELRPRKRVNCNENATHCETVQSSTVVNTPAKVMLACVTALMLASNVASAANVVGHMSCIPGGVTITTNDVERYELCVEGNCCVKDNPRRNETIHFPPGVLLHEHHVQLKLFEGQSLSLLEASCPPASFCENIRCWICTANIFNPECSPRAAITAIAFIIYIAIALGYALCYVPVAQCIPQWKVFRVFTRNTFQKVVDSKRCAHVGSCVDDKCASTNTSSLLPELVQGNQFPGMTMCVESCGGIGCGCLALSSGCLFYRIFHVPQDEKIYEIFKCSQWKEEVELEITTISKRTETINKRLIRVQPTVPINYNKMRITLTSLSFPPTPMLASSFISDGSQMALWNHKETPQLLCDSEEHARLLNCTVTTNCRCEPAENKVTCVCTDFNLTRVFSKEIENRSPIRRG
ncbi:hypothetical protein V3C99_016342 [Haemonchus contortus]